MRAVFSVDIISLTLQRKLLEELVQRFVIKVLLCLSEHQQETCRFSSPMVNCSPLQNSKRCFKAK
ncbi:conserved hypothetical protein [Treponema phagedenis]|uniref:Uncharacterized protein n=1 Tax=Treponema phagedenis TaxID=162 RepID=A0A0B7H0W5_TREPH|nr:conserved hypothetical protein [Treponema phagedenis]